MLESPSPRTEFGDIQPAPEQRGDSPGASGLCGKLHLSCRFQCRRRTQPLPPPLVQFVVGGSIQPLNRGTAAKAKTLTACCSSTAADGATAQQTKKNSESEAKDPSQPNNIG